MHPGTARLKGFGAWLSLVERLVRDQEAGGSNPLAPTISQPFRSLPRQASASYSARHGRRDGYTIFCRQIFNPASCAEIFLPPSTNPLCTRAVYAARDKVIAALIDRADVESYLVSETRRSLISRASRILAPAVPSP